jgi:hypothetical protein
MSHDELLDERSAKRKRRDPHSPLDVLGQKRSDIRKSYF